MTSIKAMPDNPNSKSILDQINLTAGYLAATMSLAVLFIVYLSIPPRDFPEGKIVSIKTGMTISETARELEDSGIIKSSLMFRIYVPLISGHRRVLSGNYLFDRPQSSLRAAYRLVNGIQGIDKIRVTIFEGMSSKDIARSLKKSIKTFDSELFLSLAKPHEGYLFPDTYFLEPDVKPEEVVRLMRNTFNRKISDILPSIRAFDKPMRDIMIMASIVERETNSSEDRKIIAGILWKRLDMGMALQVDAPFHYVLGKDSAKLTLDDLNMDSPYNLYRNTGLTPAPISNPGLETIKDTISPIETKYLFYLSDKNGKMHYAEDHEGHVANKAKYLY